MGNVLFSVCSCVGWFCGDKICCLVSLIIRFVGTDLPQYSWMDDYICPGPQLFDIGPGSSRKEPQFDHVGLCVMFFPVNN